MILYFKIDGKEYKTIDSDKLNINQYLNILDILESDNNLQVLSKDLFYEITDLEPEKIEQLSDYSLVLIDWTLYIKDLNNLNKIKKEYFGYKLRDLNNLNFGNYIDLDYFLIQQNKNRIIDVVALMLLGTEYKIEDIETSKEVVNKMKTKDVISIYNYFTSYRMNIFKQFSSLFEDVVDDDEEYTESQLEELKKEEEIKKKSDEKVYSNWLETAYMLTNKDITKNDEILNKPLLSVLNYLTWLKTENDKEIQRMKK